MNKTPNSPSLENRLQDKKNQSILEWDTALYTEYERGPKWYSIAVALALLTVVISLIFGSKTFALVIIAISIVYFLQAKKEVPQVKAIITPVGVQFGNQFHSFEDIECFWIEKHLPNFQSLHLVKNTGRIKDVEIQFYQHSDQEIINILRRFIPYNKNKKPGTIDHLVHILKL